MQQLTQLVGWAAGRYRSVAKTYAQFDECWTPGGATVYCSGTLSGVWLDGTAFSGIRFIDRFEVAGMYAAILFVVLCSACFFWFTARLETWLLQTR